MNDFAKRAFYLAVGAASQIAEEVEKNLNELGSQAQEFFQDPQRVLDDLIERGEAEVNGANIPRRDEPSARLKRQLYNLVLGDMELADRLLASVRERYPNQSEDWYWEKVIRDLERDRRN
ncbi:MAG: hypothetical protein F6J93_26925 [Oscillatoria sp. SIO1A7]|nr:hypothetical protein [Oscillatoria sp. SIO1A7]